MTCNDTAIMMPTPRVFAPCRCTPSQQSGQFGYATHTRRARLLATLHHSGHTASGTQDRDAGVVHTFSTTRPVDARHPFHERHVVDLSQQSGHESVGIHRAHARLLTIATPSRGTT